jgi:acyl-coenzyme A thioesterase PaaI-like protein
VLGSGLITFARITRAAAPGMDDYDPGAWVGETRTLGPDGATPATPYERMRLEFKEPGTVVLPLTPYVVNAIGTITGGAQAAQAEAAAESLLPGLVATDVQVHFLAQLRSDHLVSASRVVRSTPDHGVVAVLLLDGGDPDRVAAMATVTLTR